MDSIFLLYLLAFIPVKGVNSGVIITTRDALFIQTGIRKDYDVVKKNVEKRIPKTIALGAGLGYRLISKKELEINSRAYGHWNVAKDRVHVSWGFSW